jgi:hypothetical protein
MTLLAGLLLLQASIWSARYVELDREIGMGPRFWGIVILIAAASLVIWLSVRALVVRRGRFTLKEFLVFVLLIGSILGWLGSWQQKTRGQRVIARLLTEHGATVRLGGQDQPGFERWLGREYFHSVKSVEIDLARFPANDLAVLAGLPELKTLTLRSGKLAEDDLRHVGHIPALTNLMFTSVDIEAEGLAHLAELPHLQNLTFFVCKIDDDAVAHLPRLSHLKSLSLVRPLISDAGLASVGQCTQLETLTLASPSSTEAGLAHLGRLPRLSSLTLHGSFGDAALEHVVSIEGLTYLNLLAMRVTDAGIASLGKMQHLTKLELSQSKVTRERLEALQTELPNLRVFLNGRELENARPSSQPN